MDVTGLLDTVLAVAVYPGALYLFVAAILYRTVAGRRNGPLPAAPVPVGILVPLVAVVAGTAMLPLTGSPALHLPPPEGAAGNLVGVIMLLGVAVACSSLPRTAGQLAALGALALLAIAAASGSVSVVTIAAAGGPAQTPARLLAGLTLLLAAATPPASTSRGGAVVRAALALAAAAATVPAALGDAPGVAGALLGLGVVALSAGCSRGLSAWAPGPRNTVVPGGLAALTAIGLALLGGRL